MGFGLDFIFARGWVGIDAHWAHFAEVIEVEFIRRKNNEPTSGPVGLDVAPSSATLPGNDAERCSQEPKGQSPKSQEGEPRTLNAQRPTLNAESIVGVGFRFLFCQRGGGAMTPIRPFCGAG